MDARPPVSPANTTTNESAKLPPRCRSTSLRARRKKGTVKKCHRTYPIISLFILSYLLSLVLFSRGRQQPIMTKRAIQIQVRVRQ
jgi:hypothetical protein